MQAQAATLASPGSEPVAMLVFLSPDPVRGGCGYFDSSFELSHGLRVIEESDPTVLQLWVRVLDGALTVH